MLIADTHVHIYPAYDVAVALDCAFHHLTALAPDSPDTSYALLLTERYDCSFFRDLASHKLSLPPGYSVSAGPEIGCLLISHERPNRRLLLFAGRQVVTADGIEVLALLTLGDYPDRQDTRDTVRRIRNDGGVPVLSWSPGKWLGHRGKVIGRLIEEAGGNLLAIGDTAMRPRGFPAPSLMRRGKELGLPVLAGSDPLPFAGDEVSTGRYATVIRSFDAAAPVSSLRAAIVRNEASMAGQRDPLPRMLARWIKNQRARKAAP